MSQILIEVNWARERQAQAEGRRQEAGEDSGEVWDVPPELGGRGVGDAPQYP